MFMEGTPAKAIFYVLTFLSISVMFWQIFGRAKYWMKGQKLTWKPHYIKGILTYVIGQRKVMGSRPRSGAPMHLLIFYGFLGLLLATTLLAVASYAPLLGLENWHRGYYYLAYEAIFDSFGLLFLVGVSWAFIRRYRLSKKLGEPTPDPETGKLARSPNPIGVEGLCRPCFAFHSRIRRIFIRGGSNCCQSETVGSLFVRWFCDGPSPPEPFTRRLQGYLVGTYGFRLDFLHGFAADEAQAHFSGNFNRKWYL